MATETSRIFQELICCHFLSFFLSQVIGSAFDTKSWGQNGSPLLCPRSSSSWWICSTVLDLCWRGEKRRLTYQSWCPENITLSVWEAGEILETDTEGRQQERICSMKNMRLSECLSSPSISPDRSQYQAQYIISFFHYARESYRRSKSTCFETLGSEVIGEVGQTEWVASGSVMKKQNKKIGIKRFQASWLVEIYLSIYLSISLCNYLSHIRELKINKNKNVTLS